MKLSNKTLTNLVNGSIYNETKDKGYICFYRCNLDHMNHLNNISDFLYDRTFFTSSVTIEFITDADEFSFDYIFYYIGSKDTFDAIEAHTC